MDIDAVSSLNDLEFLDEINKKTVPWLGRTVEMPMSLFSVQHGFSAKQKMSVSLITEEAKMRMASCSVRRRKGDEEVEIRVEIDTRKPKPDPLPPEKPK